MLVNSFLFKIIPRVLSLQKMEISWLDFIKISVSPQKCHKIENQHSFSPLFSNYKQTRRRESNVTLVRQWVEANTFTRVGGPKPQAKVMSSFVLSLMPNISCKWKKHCHLYVFIWYFCRQDRSLRVVLRTFE